MKLLEEVLNGLGIRDYGMKRYTKVLEDKYISRVEQLEKLDDSDWKQLGLPEIIQKALVEKVNAKKKTSSQSASGKKKSTPLLGPSPKLTSSVSETSKPTSMSLAIGSAGDRKKPSSVSEKKTQSGTKKGSKAASSAKADKKIEIRIKAENEDDASPPGPKLVLDDSNSFLDDLDFTGSLASRGFVSVPGPSSANVLNLTDDEGEPAAMSTKPKAEAARKPAANLDDDWTME